MSCIWRKKKLEDSGDAVYVLNVLDENGVLPECIKLMDGYVFYYHDEPVWHEEQIKNNDEEILAPEKER